MKQKDKAKEFLEKSIEEVFDDYKNDKITLQEAKVRLREIPSLYMEAFTSEMNNDPLWKEVAPKLIDKLFNF